MAKGLLAGVTDYSHQSFNDVIDDLKNESKNTVAFIKQIEDNLSQLNKSGYWKKTVPSNFEMEVMYALKFYHTTVEELNDIIEDTSIEVKKHHINRLNKIGKVASEINRSIGKEWHGSDYPWKDYGNPEFKKVERVYGDTRDMAVNLLDIYNMAERLNDFIGKTKTEKEKKATKKILILTASPDDETRIRVDKESRIILEKLEAASLRDTFNITTRSAVKVETITKAMMDINPSIVQFSGHSDQEGIVVESDSGKSILFPTDGLTKLFLLFKDTIECVLLNSCYSIEQAEAISEQGCYVIGMEDSIDDSAAIDFSIGFYQAIGAGKSYEFAFEMGLVLISPNIDNSNTPSLWKNGVQLK